VQGDDLVAEDVVSGSEVSWDGGCGGEVVGDQVVGDPALAAAEGALAKL
jgi:hypothetical protein